LNIESILTDIQFFERLLATLRAMKGPTLEI
jgi:hypothetical protein